MTNNKLWLKMQFTGPDPKVHQPIEIAVAVSDGILGKVIGKTEILVRPGSMTNWDDNYFELHEESGVLDIADFKGFPIETCDILLNSFLSRFFPKDEKIIICGDCPILEKEFIESRFPTTAKRIGNCVIDVTAFREVVKDLERDLRIDPVDIAPRESYLTESDLENTREEVVFLIGRIQTLGSLL